MGQDRVVFGSEHNAGMSYGKGGILPAGAINEIGRTINLISGRAGTSTYKGLNGGIEIEGNNFPWHLLSFGFEIGVIEADPAHASLKVVNNKKVRIGDGIVWHGQGIYCQPSAFQGDTVEITAERDLDEFDIVYLKATLNSQGTIDALELETSQTILDAYDVTPFQVPAVYPDIEGGQITAIRWMLYIFGLENEEARLLQVNNVGDIYVPFLRRADVIVGVAWDSSTHQLKEKVFPTYVMPAADTYEAVITTAEECP